MWLRIQGELILLLLVLLIPTLPVEGYDTSNKFQTLRAEELNANLEIGRAAAKTFENFVRDVLHQELSVGIPISSAHPVTPEDVTRLLRESQLADAAICDFSRVNPEGTFIYSSNPALVGANNSDRAYFRDIAGGREWTVGELVLSRTAGEPVFGITRAIRDEKGALLGVVAAEKIPGG